jgi:ABC-type transport system involved in cytochrome bd biosynthesis fused ATPase/permease subunit
MLDEIKPISNLQLSEFNGLNGGIKEKKEIVPEKPKIVIENIVAKWGSVRETRDVSQSHNNIYLLFQDSEFTLSNISLTVNPGQLLAVIGPVGSGKVYYLI